MDPPWSPEPDLLTHLIAEFRSLFPDTPVAGPREAGAGRRQGDCATLGNSAPPQSVRFSGGLSRNRKQC